MTDATPSTADIELAVVVAAFRARPDTVDGLGAVLARYVVLTRRAAGCRNVDLLASAADPGRFLVIEKWDSPETARAHLDAHETVAMAESAVALLAAKPEIELLESVSAHDLA